ncbi:envelope stress response protein PspG [Vibrio sp. TH_r3]|uniref:envelope stress response protein PspG n=1 Tax=unclassified Vibrio TaxID=2614977 RepID=UPI002955DCBB|nr:envelope stress response protein PspG [Vibrio sp. TH_r3]MDV7106197.1 envelope stress response protein PspG [Vibrio sp. TH_r3]
MFEILFFLIFVGILFFTGLSMVTVFIAVIVSLLAMFLMGLVGLLFKLLPWLIAVGIGIWLYKNYIASAR